RGARAVELAGGGGDEVRGEAARPLRDRARLIVGRGEQDREQHRQQPDHADRDAQLFDQVVGVVAPLPLLRVVLGVKPPAAAAHYGPSGPVGARPPSEPVRPSPVPAPPSPEPRPAPAPPEPPPALASSRR